MVAVICIGVPGMPVHLITAEISAIQKLLGFNGKAKEGKSFTRAAQDKIKRMRHNRKGKAKKAPGRTTVWRAITKVIGKTEKRGRKAKVNQRQRRASVSAAEKFGGSDSATDVSAQAMQEKAFRR